VSLAAATQAASANQGIIRPLQGCPGTVTCCLACPVTATPSVAAKTWHTAPHTLTCLAAVLAAAQPW